LYGVPGIRSRCGRFDSRLLSGLEFFTVDIEKWVLVMPKQCPDCKVDIPVGQLICPECYLTSGLEESQSSDKEVRKDVMIFFRDPIHSDWFQDRIVRYMPERVGAIFYVETPEALREVTQNSVGSWGLVILDADVAQQKYQELLNFVEENPGIVVGVQYDFGTDIPARAPLKNAIMFRKPSDIDPWLLIMHQLLDRVRGS